MKTWIQLLALTVTVVFVFSACAAKKEEEKKEEEKEAQKEEKIEKKAGKNETMKEAPANQPTPAPPKFNDEDLQAFAIQDIPGYRRSMDGKIAHMNVAPRYVTEEENEQGANVEVMTTIGNCSMCLENTAATYEKEKVKTPEGLWMSNAVLSNPDLVWEFGELDVDGRKVVTVHILSYIENKTEMGTSRSGSHQFSLHWSDGTRQVRAMASSKGVFPKSLEELKTKVTKEELKAGALTVFTALAAKL